jgi:hypothetical protein
LSDANSFVYREPCMHHLLLAGTSGARGRQPRRRWW